MTPRKYTWKFGTKEKVFLIPSLAVILLGILMLIRNKTIWGVADLDDYSPTMGNYPLNGYGMIFLGLVMLATVIVMARKAEYPEK